MQSYGLQFLVNNVSVKHYLDCPCSIVTRVTEPGLWILDWTYGLDCGLIFGMDFGPSCCWWRPLPTINEPNCSGKFGEAARTEAAY